jgi:hypothetical protein
MPNQRVVKFFDNIPCAGYVMVCPPGCKRGAVLLKASDQLIDTPHA